MPRLVRCYPDALRVKTCQLRRQGFSLDELSARLHIPKITVQGWVHAIPLSARAKRRIHARIVEGSRRGRPFALEANRRKLETWKRGVRERAASMVQGVNLTLRWQRILCAMIYLCEGCRYPSSRCLGFANSDPRMIRCFLHLLRRSFAIDERRLRVQIIHRWDQSLPALVRHWSRITGIPQAQFYRSKPDPRTRGKPTQRENYRGVCYVQYPSTDLQFTLQCLGETVMKMVEPEGIEPSLHPCHGCALPLRHGPTAS